MKFNSEKIDLLTPKQLSGQNSSVSLHIELEGKSNRGGVCGKSGFLSFICMDHFATYAHVNYL